ncbi:MAG TPA: VCBS repeat-containing protein [Flavitalea sp.]|nr:VCBS repeat-containing protein [Flavitalea sp.]
MKRRSLPAVLACSMIVMIATVSCRENKSDQPHLFELVRNSGIQFNNAVADQELNNSFLFRNFYNGGGVGIGDINNDGLADVLMTSNMGENKLYLNKGNLQFDDITAKSGIKQDSMWSTGIVMADINNDGWLDLYVCNSGNMHNGNRKNKLYINNRNLSFTESAASYGLDISSYATQASFFDYDLDGDLDCFIIANSPMPVNTLGYTNKRDLLAKDWPVKEFVRDGGDHLYRNDNGKFAEVTKAAGIHGTLMSFGMGASVGDINNDGYPDIYVANDSYERDYLYVNQKDGTFKDDLENCMKQISFSSMGADMADINNDGYPEIFTTDMLPEGDYRLKTLGAFDNVDLYRNKVKLGFYHQFMKNCMQLNNGNGTFSEIANFSDVDATDWSWGALIFDADNDGFNDLYVCNGVNRDVTNLDFMNFFANDVVQKMVLTRKKDNVEEVLKHIPVNPVANKAYRNDGKLHFEDAGDQWGLSEKSFSNGAAYGDLDNDGDLDLIVNNENQEAFVYRNNSRAQNGNHSISLKLIGTKGNEFAIGSKIAAYGKNQGFYRELIPSRGFQSSMDYRQVIGIGKMKQMDSIIITWPDRSCTRLLNPAIDSLIIVDRNKSENFVPAHLPGASISLLDSVASPFEKHTEDDYIDFYYERNIPEMLSREGPRAAVADVNHDGFEDVYVGGTKGYPGQLYFQGAKGRFTKQDQRIFYQFMEFEDGPSIFFDADGDGDQDLMVSPAGNNEPPYTRLMQNRLLINDGKGNFSLQSSAFPLTGVNVGAIAAYDFDHDGDQDVFIGGHCTSRDYGTNPSSFLLKNDGKGHFVDITKAAIPDLSKGGMITGAVWADLVGDSINELIVVGEWMDPRIYRFNNGKFNRVESNLNGMDGLWNCVSAEDLNRDGKMDLVLGNIGENFYLNPTKDAPVKLWMADFDRNGESDKVLTRKIDGKDKPVFLKNDVQDQVPGIKKDNFKHHDFALKSIEDLFTKEMTEKAVVKEFNYASSIIAYGDGKGKFTVQKLPVRAQLSSVNAVLCLDVNHDGRTDIITGGNKSGFPPQLQKLDASFGDVFLNDGHGSFSNATPSQSNLNINGEVRDIKLVSNGNNKLLIFLRNDDFPKMFSIRN